MNDESGTIGRRALLRATGGVAVAVAAAGCTAGGLFGDDSPDGVVLSPPEGYDEGVAQETVHPTYGESVPAVSAPAPLRDRTVTTTDFVGDRHSLYTFLFTRCPSACPGLMASLRHVQDDSVGGGYAEDVALLPVTFDPEHDTPEVLEDYERDHGVDRGAENWYTLRPETPEAAFDVVEEGFGVAFAETEDGDMAFAHTNLVLLVNADGYVERAYSGEVPTPGTVVDDTRTVLERW